MIDVVEAVLGEEAIDSLVIEDRAFEEVAARVDVLPESTAQVVKHHDLGASA